MGGAAQILHECWHPWKTEFGSTLPLYHTWREPDSVGNGVGMRWLDSLPLFLRNQQEKNSLAWCPYKLLHLQLVWWGELAQLKANNWYFSQKAGDGAKIPSAFAPNFGAIGAPRTTTSWPAGTNVVSSAITRTKWVGGTEGISRLWNKGTVSELGNRSYMLQNKASHWWFSRKSKPRRQSASEVFKTKYCCWYRLLASDICRVTVPRTGVSAWWPAKSRRSAFWSWVETVTGSWSKSCWLMQDTPAPVSLTAITETLQTSRFTKTLFLSTTELRIAGA